MFSGGSTALIPKKWTSGFCGKYLLFAGCMRHIMETDGATHSVALLVKSQQLENQINRHSEE